MQGRTCEIGCRLGTAWRSGVTYILHALRHEQYWNQKHDSQTAAEGVTRDAPARKHTHRTTT
jgi:hypothetical protein